MTSEKNPVAGRRFAPPSGRRRWLRIVLMVVGLGTLILASAAGVAALWAFTIFPRSLPSVTALETFQPILGTKVYDDNDERRTELHVERRIFVPLAQIPQSLRDAVIATEDKRFYSHWGIGPIGVARALVQHYRRGRFVEGGSTITQQLTKVLFLTPDKSLERKLKEAVLALELERRYSKDRILEMYLNQVYFGHGAYGVEAAARTYFGKSVSELNVREAALLGGLPRAPSTYSPFDHPETAKRRREVVLRRMVEYGALKDAEAKRYARSGLGLQALHLHRGAGVGLHGGDAGRRFTDLLRDRQQPGLEAGELRPEVPRPDHAAAGDRGVGERGHGQGAGARRPQPHDPGRAALRDHEPPRRQPEPGPRDLRPDAHRADVGLRRAGQPGPVAAADDGPLRHRRPGQAARGAPARSARGRLAGDRLRHHAHAARRGRARDGPGRPGAATADRRQDRHDQRLLERVVHRLHAPPRHRRVGRLRPSAQPRQGRDGLAGGGADLGLLHGPGPRRQPQGGLSDAGARRAGAGGRGPVQRVRARRDDGVPEGHRAGGLRRAPSERSAGRTRRDSWRADARPATGDPGSAAGDARSTLLAPAGELFRWGPRDGPQTPQRSARLGGAVALLGPARRPGPVGPGGDQPSARG